MKLIRELKSYQNQDIDPFFKDWLKQKRYIRLGGYYLWINKDDTFQMKSYGTIGKKYLASNPSTVNLERVTLGENSRSILQKHKFTSLRYNCSNLPLGFFTAKKLRYLHVEKTVSFDELAQQSDLCILYLNNLGLKSLPESIGKLSQLEELYLWDNELHSLPKSISQLQYLHTINISGNNFTEIPPVLFQLPLLETICLRGVQNLSSIQQYPKAWERIENGDLIIVDAS